MKRPEDITTEMNDSIARLQEQIEWTRNHYKPIYEKCVEFGGFISRGEIGTLLDVSQPRVSQLISRNQFRSCSEGFSLADVEEYKKTRTNGRPKSYAT